MRSDREQVAHSLITFIHVTVSQLRDQRVTTKDVKQHQIPHPWWSKQILINQGQESVWSVRGYDSPSRVTTLGHWTRLWGLPKSQHMTAQVTKARLEEGKGRHCDGHIRALKLARFTIRKPWVV